MWEADCREGVREAPFCCRYVSRVYVRLGKRKRSEEGEVRVEERKANKKQSDELGGRGRVGFYPAPSRVPEANQKIQRMISFYTTSSSCSRSQK